MESFNNKKKIYAFILCNILAGLLCFAQIKANTLMIYVCLLAFLLGISFLATKSFSFPILLFFLPWSKILRPSPYSFSFYTVALLLVCIISLWRYDYRLKRYAVAVTSILAVLTLFSKWLHGSFLSLDYVMFLTMLLLFPCVKEEHKEKTYDFFVLVIFLATGVALASLCAKQFAGYGNIQKYIRVDSFLTITRRCGFYEDPNFYNAQVTAAMAGCMLLVLQIKNRYKMGLLFVLMIVLLYCGLLSGSKSFALVFLSMLILWMYMLLRMRGRTGLKSVLIIGIIAATFYVLTSSLFSELINVILTRISFANNFSDFTTGRTYLWSMYLDAITLDWKMFLFGVGFTNVYVNGYASHSTMIQTWFQLGIFGGILLVIWCAYFMFGARRNLVSGKIIKTLLLVIGVFIPWIAIDMLYADEFFLFQLYVFVGLLDGGMMSEEGNGQQKETIHDGTKQQTVCQEVLYSKK